MRGKALLLLSMRLHDFQMARAADVHCAICKVMVHTSWEEESSQFTLMIAPFSNGVKSRITCEIGIC